MSEDVIIKHMEHAVKNITRKESTWQKKIGGFLLEVFIIVLAVSLTIWFHNWNDQIHEQHKVKEFLTGLRQDLGKVVQNLDTAAALDQPTVDYYDSVWNQIVTGRINAPFVDSGSNFLFTSNYFKFDPSRYESFKSSGYLGLITDQELLKDITGMYDVRLPSQQESDKIVFDERRTQFITYIGSKAIIDAHGMRVAQLLNDPAVRFQINWQRGLLHENMEHKQVLKKRVLEVAAEIDAALR
jgi:hypothetical protein